MPIYDSDVAAERFANDQWRTTEFWEKVRARESLKRRMWILAIGTLVILLSGIPVTWERRPKWATWTAARQLATQIQSMHREAAQRHTALRLILKGMAYEVVELANCDATQGMLLRQGTLLPEPLAADFQWITGIEAERLGFRPLADSICYDPRVASASGDAVATAFVVAPKSDLAQTAPRHDRFSSVTVLPTGEVSF